MILRTENIVKKYRQRTVVNNVSVEVSQGEIVGLLGPNGAGKTTSFYIIVGLIKPFSGKVFLENDEITEEPMYKRAQRGIGYLAQEASVFRKLTVEDNIRAVLEFTNRTKAEQKEKLEALLEEFGLNRVRKSLGIQLSGGKEEGRKSPVHWQLIPSSSSLMSLLPALILLLWKISRKLFPV